LLTKFPMREFVLSDRKEPKDLSSHATMHVYPERPAGVEGSLLLSDKDTYPERVRRGGRVEESLLASGEGAHFVSRRKRTNHHNHRPQKHAHSCLRPIQCRTSVFILLGTSPTGIMATCWSVAVSMAVTDRAPEFER